MALSMFLEHVERNLCDLSYQFSAETIDHMYRATQQIVELVVDDIGRIKPHLDVKEVIRIGSFPEGTKICSPNEFDFLACFDFLSRSENVRIEGTEGCQPGYMVAFLNSGFDKAMANITRLLYKDICCIHQEGLRVEFVDTLKEVVKAMSKKKIVTPHGVMVIKGSDYLALKLEWHKFKENYEGPEIYSGLCERDLTLTTSYSLDISVDIMPAVSVEDFSPLSDIHGFPRYVFGMTGNLKFHLVCKVSGQSPNAPYLHISHATTEVFLVHHLHPIHKKCYRVLKYLLTHNTYFNRPIKDISLSSYVFKTAVLFHEHEKLCSGTPDTVTCCIEIIQYVRVKLRQGVFPPFLMRTTNVWGQCYKIPVSHAWRPSGLNREICSFDWCFVLWFQLWRQFLGKALTIFRKIKLKLQTEEPETSDSSTLLNDASLTSLNNMSQTRNLVDYIPNKYDSFLDEFAVLREDAFVITTKYSGDAKDTQTISLVSRCPSEKVWELVLPKFPEYLSRIESVCSREISIPKEEFEEVVEVG